MPLVALCKGLREQLGMSGKLRGQEKSVFDRIIQARLIVRFTVEGQTNMMFIHGWLLWEPPVEFSSTKRITPLSNHPCAFSKNLLPPTKSGGIRRFQI